MLTFSSRGWGYLGVSAASASASLPTPSPLRRPCRTSILHAQVHPLRPRALTVWRSLWADLVAAGCSDTHGLATRKNCTTKSTTTP